jgi:DNA-binding Xre family transcriptional regulator
MNYKKTHIGKLVQQFVKQNNISSSELARQVGKTRQNIYDLYKRDDVEVKLLLTLCDALNHNFIEDIYHTEKNAISIDTIFDTLKTIVEEKINQS